MSGAKPEARVNDKRSQQLKTFAKEGVRKILSLVVETWNAGSKSRKIRRGSDLGNPLRMVDFPCKQATSSSKRMGELI